MRRVAFGASPAGRSAGRQARLPLRGRDSDEAIVEHGVGHGARARDARRQRSVVRVLRGEERPENRPDGLAVGGHGGGIGGRRVRRHGPVEDLADDPPAPAEPGERHVVLEAVRRVLRKDLGDGGVPGGVDQRDLARERADRRLVRVRARPPLGLGHAFQLAVLDEEHHRGRMKGEAQLRRARRIAGGEVVADRLLDGGAVGGGRRGGGDRKSRETRECLDQHLVLLVARILGRRALPRPVPEGTPPACAFRYGSPGRRFP